MLLLTTGRIVDISVHRARFHALQHKGPAPDAVHTALYPLVDVLYRMRDADDIPRRGWTEHDYVYSGYTLADIHRAENWSEAEKAEFICWVKQDTQKQRIETARRRLADNQTRLSAKKFIYPRQLYSSLQLRLEALPLQRASAMQWRATINNMHQSGIRDEEITWSGLRTFISTLAEESVLSKQQILEAIDFSNIRLELSAERICGTEGGLKFREVALCMPHQVVYRAALKLDDSCHCVLRFVDGNYNYRVGVIKTLLTGHHMELNKYWFALDPYGRAVADENDQIYFSDSETAMMVADRHARDCMGLYCNAKFHTRYDHLTLYGGHEYREWLVSLPDYQQIHYGAHHFDHNVLVHIRTTTRRDNQHRKLLFIEEVQSDWHQKGRTDGYKTSYWGKVANAPFKKEWPALATKLLLIHASQNGFDGLAWPDGAIQENRYSRQLHAIKRHYDVVIPAALNRLGKTFCCRVEKTAIKTRDPWLNLVRSNNKWRVSDGKGKFQTRDKYHSRDEAMTVLHRHCKTIDLPVSMYLINESLRQHISSGGLPLFGDTILSP